MDAFEKMLDEKSGSGCGTCAINDEKLHARLHLFAERLIRKQRAPSYNRVLEFIKQHHDYPFSDSGLRNHVLKCLIPPMQEQQKRTAAAEGD